MRLLFNSIAPPLPVRRSVVSGTPYHDVPSAGLGGCVGSDPDPITELVTTTAQPWQPAKRCSSRPISLSMACPKY